MQNPGKWIIGLGLTITLLGMILYFWYDRFPRAGPGQLPLDFKYESEKVKIYFPLGTSLLLSVVISVILYLISKMNSK